MKKNLIKSPINYTGNKYRLLNQFKQFFPEKCNLFVDLFSGGATVGFNIDAKRIVLIDNNERVIDLLKFLSKTPFDNLIKSIFKIIEDFKLSNSYSYTYQYYKKQGYIEGNNGLKKYNEEGYYSLRDSYNKLSNKKSPKANTMLYVLMVYAFNNDIRFNEKGEFNLPVGKTDFNLNNYKKLQDFSSRAKEIQYEFMCSDFRAPEVERLLLQADFVYCDPPYLIGKAFYNEKKGWTNNDEKDLLLLLSLLDSNGISFALSNVIEKKGAENYLLKEWINRNYFSIHYLDYHYASSSYNKKERYAEEKEVLITNNDGFKYIDINNRRYIGSKTSLLGNIEETINHFFSGQSFVLFEPFAGTGVVSNYFANKNNKVIVNDFLYHNYVNYNTWLSNEELDLQKIKQFIKKYNSINAEIIDDNYFSITFGGKYYHNNDAKVIGFIREDIEENKSQLTKREYYTLLSSLLYEADRIANTVGHFESYLSKKPEEHGVMLRVPRIKKLNKINEIYCEDANQLAKSIVSDVVYVDPPYNARQYVNFYHVLENLAMWEKPSDLEGNSMKFKRDHLKSEYSRAKAPVVFRDLINSLKTKLIVVSYNNTYKANSGASINKISEQELFEILSEKGKTYKIEIGYKFFNSGKTKFDDHKEYLYVCEVKE